MRLISGTCQHESLELSQQIAEECKDICDKYGVEYYFKASYDKANRTHIDSKRGKGRLQDTLFDLSKIKKEVNVNILTDVHDREQLRTLLFFFDKTIDVIQIPAFLSRQTDLIVDASRSGKIINIKKGQFMSPESIKHALDKVKKYNNSIIITQR